MIERVARATLEAQEAGRRVWMASGGRVAYLPPGHFCVAVHGDEAVMVSLTGVYSRRKLVAVTEPRRAGP